MSTFTASTPTTPTVSTPTTGTRTDEAAGSDPFDDALATLRAAGIGFEMIADFAPGGERPVGFERAA
ncbi:MAG: hypothetical protein R3246_11655 [Acidimicrobiia bacterium]|nr:hypothetical protein [Acidimicrobiia bacterium]